MKKFFSTFEVAKFCHVSPGSVIRWIREGKLRAAITAGGHHRIHLQDLCSLLTSLRMPVPGELEVPKEEVKEATLKILVVDDEPNIRHLIRSVISKHFPTALIEEASDGFRAGWLAHALQPDLILLDLMLPGLDGFKVCEMMHRFPELKNTKIIAMTGLIDEGIEERVRGLGAGDFLTKPFDLKTLEEKLGFLRGPAPQVSSFPQEAGA